MKKPLLPAILGLLVVVSTHTLEGFVNIERGKYYDIILKAGGDAVVKVINVKIVEFFELGQRAFLVIENFDRRKGYLPVEDIVAIFENGIKVEILQRE